MDFAAKGDRPCDEDPVTWASKQYSAELLEWKEKRPQDYMALIDAEHRRWMAYSRSEGMQKANMNMVKEYYREVGKKHVDILGGFTPCLVDALTELQTIGGDLKKDYPEEYTDSWVPFWERDTKVVEQAGNIVIGLDIGVFPEE